MGENGCVDGVDGRPWGMILGWERFGICKLLMDKIYFDIQIIRECYYHIYWTVKYKK
jgi:hypothetical protein